MLVLGIESSCDETAAAVVEGGQVLSSERIIDELWGERPPATAAKALQVHVWRLRAALGGNGAGEGPLRTQGGGYVLRAPPGVRCYRALVQSISR